MDHPLPVDFVRWIVLLPLIGAAINFLGGAVLQHELGKRAISIVGCGTVAGGLRDRRVRLGHDADEGARRSLHARRSLAMVHVGRLQLDIAFWLDPLSMMMVLIITGVGGLIHIYSTGYMHDDDVLLALLRVAQPVHLRDAGAGARRQPVADVRRLGRRGLCSFALIGFWYKVLANTTAGNKAFIVNRVGDWAFVIALYSLFAGLQAVGSSDAGHRATSRTTRRCRGWPKFRRATSECHWSRSSRC